MKPNTCLVIDTWEGQLEIDEAVLKANGVAGIGIRLNDMNGGHHMDTNFVRQWNEAANFVRFPYFVYNPWVNGAANFTWLRDHLPAGVKTIAADIEVRYPGYPANTYAGEVVKFLNYCKTWGLKTIIYTGQWFLPYLSSWPRVDYWWAQYPDPATYFRDVKTWDELKIRLDILDQPFNAGMVPGTLKMWQFSGDYLMLPGNSRDLDVNIFYGSEADLAAYFGNVADDPIIIPTPETPHIGWLKPRYVPNGPAIIAGSDAPKANHPTIALGAAEQAFIKQLNLNDAGVWRLFTAPDVGPTKGINGNGKMIYIVAGWSGNVVKIIARAAGWVKVESINLAKGLPLPGVINHVNTPTLVHRMTTVNSKGQFIAYPAGSAWNKADDPLFSTNGEFWIPVEWVSELAAITTNIHVRSGPGKTWASVGSLSIGQRITIRAIARDGMGNKWGQLAENRWCCLEYQGAPYVDWKLK